MLRLAMARLGYVLGVRGQRAIVRIFGVPDAEDVGGLVVVFAIDRYWNGAARTILRRDRMAVAVVAPECRSSPFTRAQSIDASSGSVTVIW